MGSKVVRNKPIEILEYPVLNPPVLKPIYQNVSVNPGNSEFTFEYTKNCEFITEKSCCICFIDYNDGMQISMLPCNHLFHRPCLMEWYQKQKTCPICRCNVITKN